MQTDIIVVEDQKEGDEGWIDISGIEKDTELGIKGIETGV